MMTNLQLADGVAEYMGDGVFVLAQKDERGSAQSVVVTVEDLRRLTAALGQPERL